MSSYIRSALRMCEKAGIDEGSVSNVTLLRDSINHVYLLEGLDVVLRMRSDDLYSVQRNLDIVNNVANGADVLRSWIADAVYDEETRLVGTFWKCGQPVVLARDAHAFGKAVKSLQNVTPPTDLPVCDPLKPVVSRLLVAEEIGVPVDMLNTLRTMYETVIDSGYYDMMADGNNLVHRDAHVGNAVKIDGQVKLIDMDTMCRGVWQYDFIPSYVSMSVMEKSRVDLYRQVLVDVYDELMDWEWLDLAVLTRKTTMLTWLATKWDASVIYRNELEKRLNSLETGENNLWTPL